MAHTPSSEKYLCFEKKKKKTESLYKEMHEKGHIYKPFK
jgi:hypothetical protein